MDSFQYPILPAPRTAVLVPWFEKDGGRVKKDWGRVKRDKHREKPIRVFADGWTQEVAAFAPAAIAGTFEQMCALERQTAPSLTHALIVLGRPGAERLTEENRDYLWRAFGVPVFEQVIGKAGELLAAECEAHDGLHVESARLPIENEYVDATTCACGRKTPRIGGTQGTALLKRVAAYAR